MEVVDGVRWKYIPVLTGVPTSKKKHEDYAVKHLKSGLFSSDNTYFPLYNSRLTCDTFSLFRWHVLGLIKV